MRAFGIGSKSMNVLEVTGMNMNLGSAVLGVRSSGTNISKVRARVLRTVRAAPAEPVSG